MTNKELFTNRVYGIQIIKSKNSNYNADFTGSPRTLPDGTVYSTDKVNKFNIRKYLGRNDDSLIFTKTIYKNDLKPMVLKDVYEHHFGDIGKDKTVALKNLLSKLDVRLFGATFAPKGADGMNISIHGPVQVSYGINRFEELKDSGMYTDQIGSPYASKEGADQSTLGSQTRSQEAHYVHHFSINPKNLSSYVHQFQNNEQNQEPESTDGQKTDFQLLLKDDVQLLKEAMAVATTYYDSTSKKDSENELLLWIELKEDSEKVFKNFTDLITVEKDKILIKDVFAKYIENHADAISKIELAYDKYNTKLDLDYENCQEIPFKNGEESKFKCEVVNTNSINEISGNKSDTKNNAGAPTSDNNGDTTSTDKVPFIIYEDLNFVKYSYDMQNKPNDENN